jgi:ketosteroid isomerase-like protein
MDPRGESVVLGGESTDVLRRQPDGRWLIAIDDPWGARVLGPA